MVWPWKLYIGYCPPIGRDPRVGQEPKTPFLGALTITRGLLKENPCWPNGFVQICTSDIAHTSLCGPLKEDQAQEGDMDSMNIYLLPTPTRSYLAQWVSRIHWCVELACGSCQPAQSSTMPFATTRKQLVPLEHPFFVEATFYVEEGAGETSPLTLHILRLLLHTLTVNLVDIAL